MSSAQTEPTVRPKLGPTGKPIRRGRWTFVSHQYNGPVWRLDGTTLDLEHDPDCHAVCIGGDYCNGGWILYRDGDYAEPVAEYLSAAMELAQEDYDRALWKALGGEDIRPAAAYL